MKEVHVFVVDLDKPTTGEEQRMFNDEENVLRLAILANGFKVNSLVLDTIESTPCTISTGISEHRISAS